MSSAAASSGLTADRPFPGLRPYRFEDHEFFFGRDEQFFSLYRLLDHSRFIAVVGSSGSGKSSLVRAGLLPLLDEESRERTGRTWSIVEIHPGDSPIGNLATAMASKFSPSDDANVAAAKRERIRFALQRSSFGISDALREIQIPSGTSIILVIDQFEELFRYSARQQITRSPDEARHYEEATQFVQMLLGASGNRALNVYVLVTMRSDFIGDCANFRGLPEAVSATQFLVPSLTRDQREQAIRGPVEKVGATIEPALVERLLNDSGDDIDQLPVLQHCLLRLWEQAGQRREVVAALAREDTAREGTAQEGTARLESRGLARCLGLEDYQAIGGLSGALSKHANEILEGLPGDALIVEQIFRSLAEIDGQGRIVRRARLFRELCSETGMPADGVRKVVDRFRDDDCSFLTPSKFEGPILDDTRIDVGHEALLRGWERVSGDPRAGSPSLGWLRAEVGDARIYRGLLLMAESKSDRIATDIVEERWKWWRERPRTPDWAKRYGGGLEDVERLFKESLARLSTQREEKRQRENDAADRQRMELDAAAARDRAEAADRYARLTRYAATFVCVLLVAVTALAVTALLQWRIARQQTNIAMQKSAMAQADSAEANKQSSIAQTNFDTSMQMVTTMLGQVQEALDQGHISVAAAQAFLTSADHAYNKLQNPGQSPTILLSEVQLLVAFADTYSSLQDDATALKYAQQAQNIANKLVKDDSGNPEYNRWLFVSDYNAGDAQSALSNTADAMQSYQAALAVVQALANTDHTTYKWMQYEAFVMNKIGDVYIQQDGAAQALQTYQSALAIDQTLADANQGVDELQRDLATALMRVADAEATANPSDALEKYNAALLLRQALAANKQDDLSLQSNLATTYSHIANVYLGREDFLNASKFYNLALVIQRTLATRDPSNAAWQSAVALEHESIGNMMVAQRTLARAIEEYEDALKIRNNLVARDSKKSNWIKSLVNTYVELAGAYVENGDRKNAAEQYQNALKVIQDFLASNPTDASFDDMHEDLMQKIQKLGVADP